MQQSYVCTNCYHVGAGKKSGSLLLELALWLICFPVGIWYSLYRSKHRHGDCPQCKGSKTMIPAATPRGQELLQKVGLDLPASYTPATGNTPSVPLYGSQKPKSRKAYWIVGGLLALGALSTEMDRQKEANTSSNPVPAASVQVTRQTPAATQTSQREQAQIGKALAECKSAIANHLGADGSGMIPDVKNFGSGNEFVFGWPKGSFQMHTAVVFY